MWTDLSSRLIDTAKSTLGLTRGGNKSFKELWWWNQEVQTTIQEKKAFYKIWYKSKNPNDKSRYKKPKRLATKAVARAKSMAYNDIWKEYFQELLNFNTHILYLDEHSLCQNLVQLIIEQEIITCLKHMKNNKARGPDDIPIESLKA
ncbi:uncharacterized protein LOC135928549 [Gordionus sp. m RMFG-2023]|uniref:uncharacterized protein LOC135928549 n=1 Tax=Gordionus sp. m RMFG-2023 TaxID=3053472 RepID=UPI0031FC028B